MNEQGVDAALFTRIGGDWDLGPPGPCIADGRPQAFEKSQLPGVAERGDRGEGPDRNIQLDGRAVASKLEHADVLQLSALERPDQLSRPPECSCHLLRPISNPDLPLTRAFLGQGANPRGDPTEDHGLVGHNANSVGVDTRIPWSKPAQLAPGV